MHYSPIEMYGVYSPTQMREGGYTASEMHNVFTIAEIHQGGYTATGSCCQLHSSRIARCVMVQMKFTMFIPIAEIHQGGYTATEVHAANYTAAELHTVYGADEVHNVYTIAEIHQGGLHRYRVHAANYTAAELQHDCAAVDSGSWIVGSGRRITRRLHRHRKFMALWPTTLQQNCNNVYGAERYTMFTASQKFIREVIPLPKFMLPITQQQNCTLCTVQMKFTMFIPLQKFISGYTGYRGPMLQLHCRTPHCVRCR